MLHDHIPFPSATRRVARAALLALAAGAVGGCYPAGSVALPTTASVTMTAGFPAGGAIKCVAGATWTYQLLNANVSASEGSGTSIRKVDPTDEFFPDYNDSCTVRNTQIGLRAGRWRITVLLGIASNSCEVDLHNGGNNLTFVYGVPGCS